MIKELILKNCVKHNDKWFQFNKGLTIIKGKNGNGKSLIQEMIRFALFGSSALRGKVSDYHPNMQVTLKCTINGDDVIIVRGLKDCVINGIIKGTTPCNEWIRKKLGYDLTVFDMGNAAKQGEIAKLGRMKPSERKLAIDQVVGLTAVTKLIKELKEEKSELKNYVNGVESVLIEPEEPIKPERYKDSTELSAELDKARKYKSTYDLRAMKVKELMCVEPVWTGETPRGSLCDESLHLFAKNKVAELEKLDELGSQYTEEQLNEMLCATDQWRNWKEPELSMEVIEKEEDNWVAYDSWNKIEKVTCPKCGETFAINYTKEVSKPEFSKEFLEKQKRLHLTRPKYDKPVRFIDDDFVAAERKKMAQKKEYDTCLDILEQFGEVDYDRLREYEKYKEQLKKYEEYQFHLDLLKKTVKPESEETIKQMESDLLNSKVYEENLKRYESDKQKYDNFISEIEEKRSKMNDLDEGIKGLNEFMTRVKNSIIPSLSKVSSELVSEMTNGAINEIKVNDDFEITTNGKEICLLSGGEEAGVNLAIRLALSSILTRKVFNVFIGDEVDQSMDDERAELTANTLRNLNKQIEQMILISHKDIEGDYVIDI